MLLIGNIGKERAGANRQTTADDARRRLAITCTVDTFTVMFIWCVGAMTSAGSNPSDGARGRVKASATLTNHLNV